eukprot:TRINITY_DN2366_c0_g1_i3.p1 TRINITY_DN2366_c0_g1~~TRINITY_DN2366_c0_g1_i3.p1  ORF type:complete len:210 (+),score=28.29 TRINITY_DN2366_c0_g1_i3:64-693(+)
MDNESPDSAFSEKDDPEDDDDPEIHGDDILDGGAATPAAPLSDSLDDVIAHPDGSRDDRNFSFLCWNVAEQLKQGGPQTRDELSDRTGFSRQRVCTVISVFKAIGLVSVRENDTKSRKAEVIWQEEQAQLMPDIHAHVQRYLAMKSETQELRDREAELKQRLAQVISWNVRAIVMSRPPTPRIFTPALCFVGAQTAAGRGDPVRAGVTR